MTELQETKRELSFTSRVLKEIPSLYVREVGRVAKKTVQEVVPGTHTHQLLEPCTRHRLGQARNGTTSTEREPLQLFGCRWESER